MDLFINTFPTPVPRASLEVITPCGTTEGCERSSQERGWFPLGEMI
jgi:hypothetical protein